MAAREHRVSRRVLLGAACAFPLAGPSGALPSSFPRKRESSWIPDQVRDDEKWSRALADFRRAEAALLAAEGAPDHLFDARNDAFHNALRRLLRAPAPDLAALALKIDLVVDHEVVTLTGGDPCLDTVKQDAHRLALRSS